MERYRYNNESFQKKDGSRASLFNEEKSHLPPLPKTGLFKLSIWKIGKVQYDYDYHVYVEKMYYSVPYSFIKKEVSIRISDTTVEIFFDNQRIATHKRLSGSAEQHSTMKEHMPRIIEFMLIGMATNSYNGLGKTLILMLKPL